ncbi:maleylpyruvate isomerase family mycothiol-dependent enzyme [Corynebacterium tapiri]|uniref:Maleylpyruvate isomerase family mycothiol-dependent enzyme n=1 Tax=Corynebacterium tapiri TaxID=1448266 RepID=A0A5C4U6C9_9CORY|nr:maleylpyruvate isomerase family mycothiol-dependent enzyme [Corynebacterium tapiri]TNM00465.1 maleylpyruvate isomerase family mycothiol-dependent enzyme [Corynebacterium tapiri]
MTSFHDLSLEQRLDLVRRGTALYSGQLSSIDNEDFSEPTLLDGWDRATLIAHVAYNANALVNLVNWATTGVKTPMYASPEARNEEIAHGATLRPDALRNLHDHTLVRLDVAWRDAPETAFSHTVTTAQGREVDMAETFWMRAREVWIHSVDLDVDATFSDIPDVILRTLLPEILGKWAKSDTGHGLVLLNTDTGEKLAVHEGEEDTVITGSLPGLVRWASGRGDRGVTTQDGSTTPTPPRWL